MTSNTFNYLLKSAQIKAALVNVMGNAVTYVNDAIVKEVFRQNTGLTPLIYDKVYKDYTGAEKQFFPDDIVTILGSNRVGTTWFRSEERRVGREWQDRGERVQWSKSNERRDADRQGS